MKFAKAEVVLIVFAILWSILFIIIGTFTYADRKKDVPSIKNSYTGKLPINTHRVCPRKEYKKDMFLLNYKKERGVQPCYSQT